VDGLNPFYSSVTGVLFNKSQTTLIQCPGGKGGSYTIPNNVTSIGYSAFDACSKLTSVAIPNSVTTIGNWAFSHCDGLTSVTIPNSVTSVGDLAFYYCDSLTSVTIPSSVSSIGASAFSCCDSLTAITVDGLNPFYSTVAGVLFNKNRTTLIQCPGGKAGSYTIPNSVTSIGDSAFGGCSKLTSVTIPNSVTSIGDSAFEGCSRLTSVTIPNSVTSIGDRAFAWTGLTSVTIPSSVTTISAWAFCYCYSLISVTVPNSVTSIGDGAFNWCTSLAIVTIPNYVTSIGSYAFYSCGSLTSVTIPDSVTSIGDYALYGCTSLTGLYFKGNAPGLGSQVFEGDHNATVYCLAGTTGWGTTFGGLPTFTFGPQANWPMRGHDSLHTGQSEYTEKAFGELKWRYPTGDIVRSSPAIGTDGTVYVGSCDYYLYALNHNGTLKWRYPTGWVVDASPAIGSDGTVYVGSADTYLYSLNPDGTLKWRYPTGGGVSSSPAIGSDGTAYVGSSDGYLYSFNPDGSLKWRYPTGSGIYSSPAVRSDGTVYVGSDDGYLYALNPDGSLKWRYQRGYGGYSSPAIGPDGTVYVGSNDDYLYALNPDGSLKWCYQTGISVASSPAIGSDGTVYVGSNDHYLYALNPDGTLRWSYQTGSDVTSSPAIASDGTVYVGSEDRYLYALHLQSQGAVYGMVRNMATDQGASVTLWVSPSDTLSSTSGGGCYSLVLGPGTFNLYVSAAGYQTLTNPSVVVKAGDVTPLDILLPTTGPLNLTRTAFIPGSVGQSFKDRAWVAGGAYPYVFSVSYGTLPPGCVLDPVAGFITGTPTTPGSYTFAIGVRDHESGYAEREYTMDVTAPLGFGVSALPRATRNTLYLYDLPITGGLPPYNVIKESGSLPTGMNLLATGRLFGTPTNTGSLTFTAKATDSGGRILRQNFSLFVDDPLSISTSYLNTGITGQPYSQTLQVMGGYGGYTWSVYSGTLPPGINLDAATGVLSGTPQAAATLPLVIMVEDSVGRQVFKSLTLTVTAPLAFVTTTLPDGARNETYSEQIRVSGGLAPYQFSYAGMLPTGLSLNQTNGIISGMPTAAMLNNIEITVSYSSLPTPQTVTASLSLRVTSTLTINTPAVLPTALLGQAISPIVLHAVSGISPYHWSLTGGALPLGIGFAAATAQLAGTPTAPGDFVFTITVTDSKQPSQTATKEFLWHVVDTQPPALTITAPTAGQFWSNAVFTVTGKVTDNGPVAAVSYQLNGGAWNPAQTANGWSNWTALVTLVAGTNTVRAYAVDAGGNISLTNTVNFVYVVSDHLTLVINPLAGGTVTGVMDGQLLEINQAYSATAQSNGTGGFVFSNWTTCAGEVLTNKPVIRFVMQSNLCLQANFVDVAKPTLAITAPTANQRWSNAPLFTVRGTAKDNVQVSNVWCQANNEVWGAATLGSGGTNWAFDVALVRGTNTVRACAEDAAGNRSLTNSVSFVYVVTDRLSVVAAGKGTISPNYSNAWLEIGRQYSMTAKASSGYAFTNWVISTNWAGGVATNKATVQFMMQSNLTLQVNFADVTRPTIAITSPKPGQKVNAVLTATGTASDNAQVAAVKYQLNSNAWAVATGTTSWSAAMSLLKGTNVLRAYALDASGNKSTTNSVTFVCTNDFQMSLSVGSAQPLTGTGLDLYLQVTPGLNCRIESSTDLVFWTTFTNFVGTNVPMHFGDPAAPNYTRRFYRAVSP
jgi:outer membrane protein assembly factor BamB